MGIKLVKKEALIVFVIVLGVFLRLLDRSGNRRGVEMIRMSIAIYAGRAGFPTAPSGCPCPGRGGWRSAAPLSLGTSRSWGRALPLRSSRLFLRNYTSRRAPGKTTAPGVLCAASGGDGVKMAAGEEEGSAAEPEQEPAAEDPRSFKDLVRLGRSRSCRRCSLRCPREQRPVPPRGGGRGAAGPSAAQTRAGSGAGPGQELRALGRCPAALGTAAPVAAIFKLYKLDMVFFIFYGHGSPLRWRDRCVWGGKCLV